MDWPKAKSLLIVLFLALDIFLGVNVYSIVSSGDSSAKAVSDAAAILESRGVALDCRIPAGTPRAEKLVFDSNSAGPDRKKILSVLLGIPGVKGNNKDSYQYHKENKRLWFENKYVFTYYDAKPAGSIDIPSDASAGSGKLLAFMQQYLTRLGITGSRFVMDGFEKLPGGSLLKYTLVERYSGFALFDNKAVFTLSERGVYSLRVSYRKYRRLTGNTKGNPVPFWLVLVRNFNGSDKTPVTGIDCGFISPEGSYGKPVASETLSYRVMLKDGRIRYFKADTAEEEQQIQ